MKAWGQPTLCQHKGRLFMAFPQANSLALAVLWSKDGLGWEEGSLTDLSGAAGPAMVSFRDKLWLIYPRAGEPGYFQVSHSDDGALWSAPIQLEDYSTGCTAAAFNGKIYLAFRAWDDSARLLLAESSDGITWSVGRDLGETLQGTPTLATYQNRLHLAFTSKDDSNRILVMSTADGSNWSGASETGQTTGGAISMYTRA